MSASSRIQPYLRVVVRQVSRNPRRTALTFLGLVVSFFLYASLQSILDTLDGLLGQSARDTVLVLRPRNEGGLSRAALPRSYSARLRDVPGIVAASPVRFHLGQGRKEGSAALVLGVEAEPFLDIYRPPSLSGAELEALRENRDAAIVGRALLEENDWEVGDRITIRPFGAGPSLQLQLVGDVALDDRLGRMIVADIDYVEGVIGGAGNTNFIQARIERAAYAAAIARQIDESFANLTVPTETTTEKAHMSTVLASLSDAFGALKAIGYLTLAVTVLIVGNSVSMSIRERTVEIATLRALGFGRGWISALVLGEVLLVSLGGALTGAGVAFALFRSSAIAGLQELQLPVVLSGAVFVQVGLLSLPVGGLAAAQPLWSALRKPIAVALRHAV